jgi:hypothetical protein
VNPIPSQRCIYSEAIVDLHNLLARGYVPVLGNDGHTVYLVQSVSGGRGVRFLGFFLW